MNIEVWSDIVCPWCYLGKSRLETALVDFRGEVRVIYRAYQLDPVPESATRAGLAVPLRVKAVTSLGDADRVEQMFAHVTALAAAEGLAVDLDRAVAADTYDAHRLVAWAAGQDLQQMMLERLQRAHFAEGVDVASRTELARLAGSVGLDEGAARGYLDSPAGADAVDADLAEARELGITAVPTFVIDRRFAIQGAQEVPALRSALAEIARREAVDIAR